MQETLPGASEDTEQQGSRAAERDVWGITHVLKHNLHQVTSLKHTQLGFHSLTQNAEFISGQGINLRQLKRCISITKSSFFVFEDCDTIILEQILFQGLLQKTELKNITRSDYYSNSHSKCNMILSTRGNWFDSPF